ncbi:MAG: mechanosensitive ion channel family protein [Rikenellaceae bacterium]|nr:mechanosensitive ion channel family protein [Rikenellaceae bacterium]
MNVKDIVLGWGIADEGWATLLAVVLTITCSVLAGVAMFYLTTKAVAPLVIRFAGRTATQWDDIMLDWKFFRRLGMLLAPIVVSIGLGYVEWKYMPVTQKFLQTWITFAAVRMIAAILDGANRIYESYPVSRNKPIKVFIQVVMIFLYCAAMLVVIQIFTGKETTALLAGLTAFAAVLMLVFKDSILGLVAGIQLSANKMVNIGDWIEMPSSGADGDVLEINLTTVKVQNWNKTITTIPTYKMVSESFTNWRGMFDSGGRRIKRAVYIDLSSVHYLTDGELTELRRSSLLKNYIEQKMAEIAAHNDKRETELDERRLTNLGTFREYLEKWIGNNPGINTDMIYMVRQLQPGPTGIPLEVYCFTADKRWVHHEKVQADLFDHVFAAMRLFNLRPFQFNAAPPPEVLEQKWE